MKYYAPIPGHEHNPILSSVPVNHPCPCGSGTKIKKCCWSLLAPVVSRADAEEARQELLEIGIRPTRAPVPMKVNRTRVAFLQRTLKP